MPAEQKPVDNARRKSFSGLCLHRHEIVSMQQSEATKNNRKQYRNGSRTCHANPASAFTDRTAQQNGQRIKGFPDHRPNVVHLGSDPLGLG